LAADTRCAFFKLLGTACAVTLVAACSSAVDSTGEGETTEPRNPTASAEPERAAAGEFTAVYSKWPLETPLIIARGEVLRTHCNWRNTTEAEIRFPREMCFGVGFFLSDGKTAPVCVNGKWQER
jgi:hypothetical protein